MIAELRTLVAVAREGSFAAAGARIGLTQAAVSAQMQRLERELGFALFDRVGRNARLNARGQLTLRQAQDLLRQYGQLGRGGDDGAPSAPITIGAIASVQRAVLPEVLPGFYREFPRQVLRIAPGVSMHLVDQVDAGEIDLAIIIRPPFAMHSDLRWTPLAREPYRLIVPRRVTGDDWAAILAREPFIRYDRSSFGGRQVEHFLRRRQIAVQETCELDELDAIIKLVARGVGVALVPQTANERRWPAGVRGIDLGEHGFHRDIGLVRRDRVDASEAAQRLIAHIEAFAPAQQAGAAPAAYLGARQSQVR